MSDTLMIDLLVVGDGGGQGDGGHGGHFFMGRAARWMAGRHKQRQPSMARLYRNYNASSRAWARLYG